jgi:hypothetical protein
MLKVIRIFLVSFILAIFILPMNVSPVVASATLREYLNTGGDGDSPDIYGANYVAMQFTSDATAHTITKIRLLLKRTLLPGDVIVSIRTTAAGVPNSSVDLVSETISGDSLSTGYSWVDVNFSTEYSLLASTQYAIVLRAESANSTNYLEWRIDSGGGLANAISSASSDGGVSWTADAGGADCLFEVYGNTALEIVSVKAFQGYVEDDDLLIVAQVINNWPPYYIDGSDPSLTFDVQLRNVANTVVLASVPLTEFDNYPTSIYLSASSTIPLTIGGAYVFRIQAKFSAAVYVDYVLTSDDWFGDLDTTKYVYFDQWVKSTAQSMETYYSLGSGYLIELVAGGGWMLTIPGGAYFTDAIPGIMDQRPSLFEYAKTKPQLDIGTDKSVYYTESDFENKVGTQVSGICTTFGNLFGIDGYIFAGYIIEALIVIVVVIGLFAGQGAGALAIMLVAGVPLMFIGNYIHAIGIQWVVVFAALMLFLFVRKFWWTST